MSDSPTVPSTTSPPARSAPPVVVAATVVVGSDAATTTVTAGHGSTAKPLDAATTRLLVGLPASDEGWRVAVTVAAPRGTTARRAGDGTLGIVDTAGMLRLGLVAPTDGYRRIDRGNLDDPFIDTVPREGTVGEAWAIDDPEPSGDAARTITLTTMIEAPGKPGSAKRRRVDQTAVVLGTDLIASVTWQPDGEDGGGSYVVTPTTWGRISGDTGRDALFPELVAREPRTDTDVIEKQLLCHAVGAPAKATWNLEPWRPDVSGLAYLLARCNPG